MLRENTPYGSNPSVTAAALKNRSVIQLVPTVASFIVDQPFLLSFLSSDDCTVNGS